MPKSSDGPESRVYEMCAFGTFFNYLSKTRTVTYFLKGAVERLPR